MRIAVLGVTEARLGDALVDLRTPKQRAMLAALALHPDRPVTPDQLVDLVWGDAPPAATTATLQSYIARLRRDLEPQRSPRAPSRRLVTVPGGYRLALGRIALDSTSFEDVVVAVHTDLRATPLPDPETAARLSERLGAALATWRGTPFSDLGDVVEVVAERSRLEELRLIASEDLAALGLARGLDATTAAELEVLTEAYPWRERLWGLRATALARSGRQTEALEVLQDVRRRLDDELGLEPGPELQALQHAILRQDPALLEPVRPGTTGSGVTPARAATVPRTRRPRTPVDGWPFVGRQPERSALLGLVTTVQAGGSAAAVVTGDPGAGTSRLCAELAETAARAGLRVIGTSGAAVEGAPPLRAWADVMSQLGLDLPMASDGSADQLQAWDFIVDAVLETAEANPLLLVVEDGHEADASTLRVLRHLVDTSVTSNLLLVVSWRARPAPREALAGVAEALARRHALRVELTGLDETETSELAAALSGRAVAPAEATALHQRTDGNPYFVVELCRLAAVRGSLAALLADPEPPGSVTDVVERRLDVLSTSARRTLRSAAVAGRAFDLVSLAAATEQPEDELLDDLDEALAAGTVVEEGIDRFRFAHSLTRDVLHASLSRSRRARLHARLAQALERRPGREGEVARHWRSAGERHARKAWCSALTAADWADRVYAYDEALALRQSARSSVAVDPTATPADRHDVELAVARGLQRAGAWSELRPVIHRALGLARETADPDRLVETATLPLTGALWQAAGHGFVDEIVVDALRTALDRLPVRDSEPRCRVLLALAGELYYAPDPGPAERESLVDAAVGVARRLENDDLLVWALLTGSTATWRAATATARLAKLDEAVGLARTSAPDGPSQVLSSALALRAVALMELGRVAEMDLALVEARDEAERQHHLFASLVIASVELPWAAMRGDHEAAERLSAEVGALSVRIGVFGDAPAAAAVARAVWDGDLAALLRLADDIEASSPLPTGHFCAALRLRAGRRDLAQAGLARAGSYAADLASAGDAWFSPLAWAMAAEVALELGNVDLAGQAAERMRGLEGTTAHTGSFNLGPLDAFAAMAAAATGDRETAAVLADEALRQTQEWRAFRVRDWFLFVRARHAF